MREESTPAGVFRMLQSEQLQRFMVQQGVQNLIWSLVIVLTALIVIRLLQKLIPRYVDEPERRYRARKVMGRTIGVIAVLGIILVWSAEGPGIATILTVIGAGLAIALREMLLSFAGWVKILVRAPFKMGDRIEINGVHGDVLDIGVLHTVLMEIRGWVDSDQSTGRIVHVPNAWIFLHGAYNYTSGFGFIWNELPFTLTFRSDWDAAREIILELASESSDIVEMQAKQQIQLMSREYLVHFSALTPFVYVRVTPNGVNLTLRYLTEARKRRGTEHALTLAILEAFKEHGGIELAYGMVGVTYFDTPQFGNRE